MLDPRQYNVVALSAAVGLLVVMGVSGCSISDSSGSLSDSSGSIAKSSESISDSSGGDKDKDKSKPAKTRTDPAYENEVADFTITYLRTNAGRVNQNAFMKGISDIASENGIVDWEASPKTYRAIGKALKRNHVTGSLFESYKSQFGDNDAGKMDDIQSGYDGRE